MRSYLRPTLLAIDEVGYLAYDAGAADLLFQVVSRRYEQKSIVITTNLPFKQWETVFPNAACAVALIDRLTHHAEIVSIDGGVVSEAGGRAGVEAKTGTEAVITAPSVSSTIGPDAWQRLPGLHQAQTSRTSSASGARRARVAADMRSAKSVAARPSRGMNARCSDRRGASDLFAVCPCHVEPLKIRSEPAGPQAST